MDEEYQENFEEEERRRGKVKNIIKKKRGKEVKMLRKDNQVQKGGALTNKTLSKFFENFF